MPTLVVPDLGDVTDPETIQQIYDDLQSAEDRLDDLEARGRVGTQTRTTSSGTFTSETIVDTVTFSQVNGHTYHIGWSCQVQSSVAGDATGAKIREDNVSGTVLTNQRTELADSGAGYGVTQFATYTAAATGSKTIVGTLVRSVGTGNITAAAGVAQQAVLHVDDISA